MSFIKILFISLVFTILNASEKAPTQEEVSKLYVATFNRAPDKGGLDYWINDSGLTLSGIAKSFFDQPETQKLYPANVDTRDFIEAVYQNLFNREPDAKGWDYWENELDSGSFTKNSFIQAVINGAKDDDIVILENKNEVGLYFLNQNLEDTTKAQEVMQNITSETSSVTSAKALTKLYASTDALKDLNTNYHQENIFSSDILYPIGIVKDDEDSIYVYSSTNEGSTIAKLVDNQLELFLKTDSSILGLAYQKNQNRFIFTTSLTSLYSLDLKGNKSRLKLFGVIGNKLSVASDDSFYTCSGANGFGVNHYDKNGNKLETIVPNVNICSSIVLNNDESKLYYTSSFDGTVNEVDLKTKEVTTIASNLGIPGTYEPITLGFDDNGELFCVPAADGLYKYENGQFNSIVDSASGAGDIVYSKEHNSFLISSGAEANIVAYNTKTLTSSNLTDKLNAFTVAKTNSGKILTCNNNRSIEKLDFTGYSKYIDLDVGCGHLVTDNKGNTYVGTTDGKILKIDETSLTANLFADYISKGVVHLSYDVLNDAIISVHNVDNTSVEIWSVPLSAPNTASKIFTLNDVTVNNNLPVVASDTSGNTYILERKANKIYKLNIQTTEFSEFYNAPLDNEAITVPDMIYLPNDDSLLISTINDYQIIPIKTKVKSTFAINNGSVDNFAMHIDIDGEITAVHSGQVFKMVYNP